MGAKIIDRGRGPEIEGTRITVYDVMDYWKDGWRYDQIAGLFRLPSDDIQAAIQYIEQHKVEVEADYQQILERHRNFQYSPEVQRKLAQNRKNFQKKLEEFRARPKGKRLEINSPDVLPCPECGSLTMKRLRGTCTLRDGTVVSDLERFQCQRCQANFFDDAAMRTIGKARQQKPHSKSFMV